MSTFTAENITFRTYAIHADIVKQAAAKADKSVSEYCRDLVIPQAAKELGVAVPSMPEMKRGRYSEIIMSAAKLVGLSPEEFERQAAERMAAAALGYQSSVTPQPAPASPKLSPRSKDERAPVRRNSTPNKRRAG